MCQRRTVALHARKLRKRVKAVTRADCLTAVSILQCVLLLVSTPNSSHVDLRLRHQGNKPGNEFQRLAYDVCGAITARRLGWVDARCHLRSDRPATNFGAAVARPMTFELIVLVWAHNSSTLTDEQLHRITSLGHPSEPQSRLFPRQLGSLFGIHCADLPRSRGGER